MILNVSTSIEKDSFIISPIDSDIRDLKGIGLYLKTINNGYIENGVAIIPFKNGDLNRLYSDMHKLFIDIFGCQLNSDKNSNSIINDAKAEAKNFTDFSQKALQIRNNEVLSTDLESFTEVLRDHHFIRTLRPFQLLAAYHLAFAQNACNFSVPGSGKTTTVLAAFDYLKNSEDDAKRVDKLLVVGPLSAFKAWKDEFKECYGRKPKVFEIMGGVSAKQVEDKLLRSHIEEDIIIASYGSLNGKKDIIQNFLKSKRTMVVLDEAHRIKNVEDGVQSFAALSLSADAKSRVVLTGTPAPNSCVDLVNLYKFIWPANDIIGYSVPQLFTMSKTLNDYRIPDLVNRLAPFFIRVKKSDLNLPEPVFHKPDEIPMALIQQKIYDAIASMAIGRFESHGASFISKRSALIRMRQASTNPSLLNKSLDDYYDSLDGDYVAKQKLDDSIDVEDDIINLIKNYTNLETPSKFVATKKLAEKIIFQDGRLLIWSEFVGTCKDLSKYLEDNGIHNKILYGATPQVEREQTIDEFHNEKSSFSVIIANPHAVGESISLHKTCHNALYLEQSYNSGTYMQSKDRIHRVGLKPEDRTNYYFFHSLGTLDSQIYDRVLAKESLMLDIIEKDEIPLLSNNADFMEDTEDDIKAIIKAYYEYREQNI
jgi:SNF2 family DNA or RNA helicase